MNALAKMVKTSGPYFSEERTVRTNLYDLIVAMTDETEATKEDLIIGAVLDLAKSGKIKWARRHRISEFFH